MYVILLERLSDIVTPSVMILGMQKRMRKEHFYSVKYYKTKTFLFAM